MKKAIIFLFITTTFIPLIIFPNIEFNVRASSYYIWRGFDLNPEKEFVIIPYANFTFGDSGFALTGLGRYSLEEKELRELDLTLTYSFKLFRNLQVVLGYTEYRFFNVHDPNFLRSDSPEAFVSLGLPWTLFQPEITAYYDIGDGDGMYFKFRIQHMIQLVTFLRFEFHSSLGYNAGQWLPPGAKTGFSDFNFTAMLPIKLGRFYIIPFASYTAVLLDSISNSRYFWYGITFGY